MSNALRKHARRHHEPGLDPLDLASIAGTITDTQHGTKTTIPNAHHRKWSWADEQAWIRCIKIPYGKFRKNVNWTNPILTKSPTGWDSVNVQIPCVIRKDGKYWLFYTGFDGAKYQMGVAYSNNPWGPFTKSTNNPIIPVGGPGEPDERHAWFGAFMYDDVDKIWKVWYQGRDAANVVHLVYQTADDPEGPWGNKQDLALPEAYLASHCCYRIGNIFWLPYYTSTEPVVIKVAFSHNGIDWLSHATIIEPGAPGEWDAYRVSNVALFWSQGIWSLIYDGYPEAGVSTLGTAVSSFGFRYYGGFTTEDNWLKLNVFNPILEPSATGWDSSAVMAASLLPLEDIFYLYYQGSPDVAIGLAQCP